MAGQPWPAATPGTIRKVELAVATVTTTSAPDLDVIGAGNRPVPVVSSLFP
jgi:hypothetical protein